MNCNKPYRFNGMYGSLVPGAVGLRSTSNGFDMGQDAGGEEDEYAQILALAQRSGAAPQQPQVRKQGFNWGQLGQMAGMGALAGLGGNKGVAMAPIMAMLMQLPQFKRMLSGRTPGFNPNAKTPVIDDGKYGG